MIAVTHEERAVYYWHLRICIIINRDQTFHSLKQFIGRCWRILSSRSIRYILSLCSDASCLWDGLRLMFIKLISGKLVLSHLFMIELSMCFNIINALCVILICTKVSSTQIFSSHKFIFEIVLNEIPLFFNIVAPLSTTMNFLIDMFLYIYSLLFNFTLLLWRWRRGSIKVVIFLNYTSFVISAYLNLTLAMVIKKDRILLHFLVKWIFEVNWHSILSSTI